LDYSWRINGPSFSEACQQGVVEQCNRVCDGFIGFEHAGGRAAALPKRFFWKENDGVWLELDWTGAGKTAIEGKDYAHFSATFMLDKDGDVINLPASGAIGSLVNDPAFRSGKRLTAAAYSA
jgi:phage I-like protein